MESGVVRSTSLSVSVCVCLSLCLTVREHISGTARPIFRKLLLQISSGRGSVLLWRLCDTLCTSGFMDDVTFCRNGPYGDAWSGVAIPRRSLMSMNALFVKCSDHSDALSKFLGAGQNRGPRRVSAMKNA